jgi:signal transduction histidine kinase
MFVSSSRVPTLTTMNVETHRLAPAFGLVKARSALAAVGILVSAVSVGALVAAGIATRKPDLLYSAVGPIVAAGVLAIVRASGSVRIVPALFAVAAIIALDHAFFGSEVGEIPALVGLVLVGAMVTVLVEPRWRVHALGLWSLLLFAVLIWWRGLSAEGLVAGVSTAVAFALVTPLGLAVRKVISTSDMRYQHLFESIPVAVLEQDWGTPRAMLSELRRLGVDDLHGYLDHHPEVVSRLARGVKVRAVNPATASVLGAGVLEELRRPECTLGVSDSAKEQFIGHVVALWNGHSSVTSQYRTSNDEGEEVWLQIQWTDTTRHPELGLDTVVVTATDITETKRAEEANAARLAAREEFIFGVSHELRTPLSSVVALASELGHHGLDLDPDELGELLGILAAEAASVATVVDNLLVAATLESGSLRTSSVATDVTALVRTELARAMVPVVDAHAESLVAVCDPGRTRQIVRNLAANLAHYATGAITIGGGTERGRTSLTFDVDSMSLDASELASVLGRERLLDAATLTTGFGLSLAVARRMAMAMEGDLVCTERGDRSVRFVLELPAAEGDHQLGSVL